MKRKRKELTKVEAKFLEARLNGKTLKDAAKEAGLAEYAENGYRVEQRIREKAPEIFASAGVTVARLASKVNELLDKKKTQYYTSVVLDSKEVDDTPAQQFAVQIGSKVLGLDREQVDVNVQHTHTHTMDFSNATEEDLNAFLRACAPFRRGLPSSTGKEISVEPVNVVTGD